MLISDKDPTLYSTTDVAAAALHKPPTLAPSFSRSPLRPTGRSLYIIWQHPRPERTFLSSAIASLQRTSHESLRNSTRVRLDQTGTQRVPYGDQSYITDGNAVRVRVWGKADEYLSKCTSLSLRSAPPLPDDRRGMPGLPTQPFIHPCDCHYIGGHAGADDDGPPAAGGGYNGEG